MKKPKHTILLFTVTLAGICGCATSDRDNVDKAQKINAQKVTSEDVSEFLTEAADARMMGIEEGKLAREHATSKAIQEYGEWMIRDQKKLLAEIKKLAAEKEIELPQTISEDKQDGLEDLKKKRDRDFDRKFYRMMKIDHKRDLKEFEEATKLNDAEVADFAAKYTPVIKAHLEHLKNINPQQAEL